MIDTLKVQKELTEKFTSGNDVPVDRAFITAEEFSVIMDALEFKIKALNL
ncbi:MAG: hypothetical protein R8M45_05445 [Ghiorsea sp.]